MMPISSAATRRLAAAGLATATWSLIQTLGSRRKTRSDRGAEEELRGAEQLVHRAAAGPELTRGEPGDEGLGEVLGGEPAQMTPELAGQLVAGQGPSRARP